MTPEQRNTPLNMLTRFGVPVGHIGTLEMELDAAYIGEVNWDRLTDVKGIEVKKRDIILAGLAAFLRGDEPEPEPPPITDMMDADNYDAAILDEVRGGEWVTQGGRKPVHVPWDDDEYEKRGHHFQEDERRRDMEAAPCKSFHEPIHHNGKTLYLREE